MSDLDDKVAHWLVGGEDGIPADSRRDQGLVKGSTGLLARMLTAFSGDPITGTQVLTIGVNAAGLVVPDEALSAVCFVEAVSVRMAVDGSTPTAAVGALIAAGTIFRLSGRATMHAAKFIGTAAGAFITVAYFD